MSTKDEKTIRAAWSDLLYQADSWDWTAGPALREAEKMEQRNARSAGVNYPKAEQLAGLLGSVLNAPRATVASLYGVRNGHQGASIVGAALAERFPEWFAAWSEKYGQAVRAFREER